MSKWLLRGLLISSLLGGVACDLQQDPERNSTEDATRLNPQEAPLNQTIIDTVDVIRGDQTDWKFFFVDAPTVIEVVIAFDNPKAKAVAIVRESTGVQKNFFEHRGEPLLKGSFKAKPGIYYIQIFARQEWTDYTLEINKE